MKRYTVRYTNKKNEPVITTISTYSDLTGLMNGEAKDSVIETKMSEKMSVKMHNFIGEHNGKIDAKKEMDSSL